jgi:hypothetical protein
MRDRERAFLFCLAALTFLSLTLLAVRPAPFPGDGDEAFQFHTCRAPWPDFWRLIREDAVHPPLDYLVDRGFENLLPGSAAARFPVLLWGSLSVTAFGLYLRRRAGRRAALIGALFLALSVAQVAECRRLRPYALGLLLLGTSLWLLDRLLERPGLRRAAAFAGFSIAAAMTLYLAALALALAGGAAILLDLFAADAAIQKRARSALRCLLPFVPVAVVAAGLLLRLLARAARFEIAIAPPVLSLRRLARVLAYVFLSPEAGYSFPPRRLFFAATVFSIALVAAGAILCLRRGRLRILPLWTIFGYAAVELLKRFHPHFDSFRYFLPIVPAIAALAAALPSELLGRPSRRVAGAVLLAAFVTLEARSLARYYEFGAWNFSSSTTGRMPGAHPRHRSPQSRTSR